MSKGVKITLWVVIGLLAGFALIQLVPYGRDHTNPPVTAEPSVGQSAHAEAARSRRASTVTATRRCGRGTRTSRRRRGSCSATSTKAATKLNFSEWPQRPAGGRRGDRRRDLPTWSTKARCRRSSTSSSHSAPRGSRDAEKQELIAGLEARSSSAPSARAMPCAPRSASGGLCPRRESPALRRAAPRAWASSRRRAVA